MIASGYTYKTGTDTASNGADAIIGDTFGNLFFAAIPSTGGTQQSLTGTNLQNDIVMTIGSSGKVGIGTASPATTLDVNGDITNENVKSCAMLGTDSTGKLVCQTPAMTLISTQTASSSASLSWTGLTGSRYMLVLQSLNPSAGSNTLELQFGEGAGPTWESASYTSNGLRFYNAASGAFGSGTTTIVMLNALNDASTTASLSGSYTITGVDTAGTNAVIVGTGQYYNGTTTYGTAISGYYWGDTNAITAIKLFFASGNIASGKASLYLLN